MPSRHLAEPEGIGQGKIGTAVFSVKPALCLKPALCGLDAKQWLVESYGVAIFDKDLDDPAGLLCLNLIEDFHRFNDADHSVRFHHGSNTYKRWIFGTGRRVICSDCWRINRDPDWRWGRGRSR